MARKKTVTISKDGNESEVMPSSVPLYKRLGYTVKGVNKSEGNQTAPEQEAARALAAAEEREKK